MKKLIAFLLVCVTICIAFAGCGAADDMEVDDTTQSDDTQDTQPLSDKIIITEDGKSDYIILRGMSAPSAEIDAALAIQAAIKEKCGVTLQIMNDVDAKAEQKAICVGRVSRDTSKAVTDSFTKYSEYAIRVQGEDLIICGYNNEGTTAAADCFINSFLHKSLKTLSVKRDVDISFVNPNEKLVMLGDENLFGYSIVVSATAINGIVYEAEYLNAYFLEKFGWQLEIKKDTAEKTGKEIIIGTDKMRRVPGEALKAELATYGTDNGIVYLDNGDIWLTGSNIPAVRNAITEFKRTSVANISKQENVYAMTVDNKRIPCDGDEYTVMSFNLLYGDGDGKWETPANRKNAVLTQIRQSAPDSLGVQECTEWWYNTLVAELGDEYAVVGEIMSNSTGWRNAIFYRKDKFDLLDYGTKWLSSTPHLMSKPDASSQYRVVTYVTLRDKYSGDTFVHCNSHMGFETWERPMHDEVLLDVASSFDYPVVVTADYNSGAFPRDIGFKDYYMERGFWDACDITDSHDTRSTVDICFVTPERVDVTSHDILEAYVDGIDPSDHNAVVVTFRVRG